MGWMEERYNRYQKQCAVRGIGYYMLYTCTREKRLFIT